MTAWPVRARSRQACALLGAVAVLVAGCTAAGGGSTPRADRAGPAGHLVAAGRPGRVVTGTAAGRSRVTHGSGPRMAGASSMALCVPPLGGPAVGRAVAASRLRVAVQACLCCRWCACAGACCGCGRLPPRWWRRPYLAWQCCPRWLGPPGGDGSPIWPGCVLGCGSGACPVGPARPAAGSAQARSPRLP